MDGVILQSWESNARAVARRASLHFFLLTTRTPGSLWLSSIPPNQSIPLSILLIFFPTILLSRNTWLNARGTRQMRSRALSCSILWAIACRCRRPSVKLCTALFSALFRYVYYINAVSSATRFVFTVDNTKNPPIPFFALSHSFLRARGPRIFARGERRSFLRRCTRASSLLRTRVNLVFSSLHAQRCSLLLDAVLLLPLPLLLAQCIVFRGVSHFFM